MLLLDEATSALDSETEKKVLASIQAQGRSVIMVAHRLSTVADADQVRAEAATLLSCFINAAASRLSSTLSDALPLSLFRRSS